VKIQWSPAAVGVKPACVFPGCDFAGGQNDFIDLHSTCPGNFGGAFSVAFTARWATSPQASGWTSLLDIGSAHAQDNIMVGQLVKEGGTGNEIVEVAPDKLEFKNSGNTRLEGRLALRVYVGSKCRTVESGKLVVPGQSCRYLCTVTEGGRMRIFQDGHLVAEKANGYAPRKFLDEDEEPVTRDHLYVGRSINSDIPKFTGNISSLLVWNTVVNWDNAQPTRRSENTGTMRRARSDTLNRSFLRRIKEVDESTGCTRKETTIENRLISLGV